MSITLTKTRLFFKSKVLKQDTVKNITDKTTYCKILMTIELQAIITSVFMWLINFKTSALNLLPTEITDSCLNIPPLYNHIQSSK